MPDATSRIRNLDKLHNLLIENKDSLIAAVNNDFDNRSEAETLMAEIFPLLEGIAYARKRIKRWMKPSKRHVPQMLQPASVKVFPQPVGVVGIVVPWNFPIFLGLSPLIYALAAGNHAMLKMSEFAPQTGELLEKLLHEAYPRELVAVFNGGVEVATEFTALPFDHIVFTGSTQVGKIVMKAAAENLTPVTLELGGKSPTIIHPDYPVDEAARRIAFGKCINAGQVCVSPDYILVHNEKLMEFCKAFGDAVMQRYPTINDNQDYTAIITERQRSRLISYLDDAEQKGAQLMQINPAGESFNEGNKLPMTLVLNATDDMLVMQEEIFGPILPVIGYNDLDEALQLVKDRPRPLALYYFDWDQKRANQVLANTHSGGVCINDTMSHVMADDIPFGGIGPSGIGHYHGKEGFDAFSHQKGVVRKGKFNASNMVGAPWDRPVFNFIKKLQWMKFKPRKIS